MKITHEHYSLNSERKEFLETKLKEGMFQCSLWDDLNTKLETIESNTIILPRDLYPLEIKRLLRRGEEFGKSTLFHFGETSRCHQNSIEFYLDGENNYKLCTGFALSNDGLWRSHTWLINEDNLPVETTVGRERYFGVVLDKKKLPIMFTEYEHEVGEFIHQ